MTGLTYRPLLRTDAPAILEIQLAAELAEPADEHTDFAEIKENLETPGLDLPDGSVAAVSGDRMAGYGHLYLPSPSEHLTAYVSVGVGGGRRRGFTDRRRAAVPEAGIHRAAAQPSGRAGFLMAITLTCEHHNRWCRVIEES